MKGRGPFVPLSLVVLFALSACGGGGGGAGPAPPVTPNQTDRSAAGAANVSVLTDTATAPEAADADDNRAILAEFEEIDTIGSTIAPNGDREPYGLDAAKTTSGPISAGDLVICNFKNMAGTEGQGSTIVALHPKVGSKPTLIAQDPSLLLGCAALALQPNDMIFAAVFSASNVRNVSPAGTITSPLANGPWNRPFGIAFSPKSGPFGDSAFYVSNVGTGTNSGTIVRLNVHKNNALMPFTADVIATGFPVNGGQPGQSILGPTGLQYDAAHNRLYIVDGVDNTLTAFRDVSTIPAGGIVVQQNGFSGPFKNRARRVFSGKPLNGPISSALLPNGHLVLGNTLDPDGTNLMVEIAPASGKAVATRNVDKGTGGALFGMVATGRSDDDAQLWFNDDNDDTLKVLRR